MSKITIAIPVHDMHDKENFLTRCLESLWNQSFQDFDIVVSDNSDDTKLKEVCDFYGGIDYFQNPRKGMAQNTNEAIKRSKGSLIKILYMDDFLAHDRALENIWDEFDGWWLVSGCEHTRGVDRFSPHIPKYTLGIHSGNNTIGSPSVLTIKNDHPLLFDEEMTWLLDCDYYRRLNQLRGAPTILEDINVVIGIHDGQMTNVLTEGDKLAEGVYLNKKHG